MPVGRGATTNNPLSAEGQSLYDAGISPVLASSAIYSCPGSGDTSRHQIHDSQGLSSYSLRGLTLEDLNASIIPPEASTSVKRRRSAPDDTNVTRDGKGPIVTFRNHDNPTLSSEAVTFVVSPEEIGASQQYGGRKTPKSTKQQTALDQTGVRKRSVPEPVTPYSDDESELDDLDQTGVRNRRVPEPITPFDHGRASGPSLAQANGSAPSDAKTAPSPQIEALNNMLEKESSLPLDEAGSLFYGSGVTASSLRLRELGATLSLTTPDASTSNKRRASGLSLAQADGSAPSDAYVTSDIDEVVSQTSASLPPVVSKTKSSKTNLPAAQNPQVSIGSGNFSALDEKIEGVLANCRATMEQIASAASSAVPSAKPAMTGNTRAKQVAQSGSGAAFAPGYSMVKNYAGNFVLEGPQNVGTSHNGGGNHSLATSAATSSVQGDKPIGIKGISTLPQGTLGVNVKEIAQRFGGTTASSRARSTSAATAKPTAANRASSAQTRANPVSSRPALKKQAVIAASAQVELEDDALSPGQRASAMQVPPTPSAAGPSAAPILRNISRLNKTPGGNKVVKGGGASALKVPNVEAESSGVSDSEDSPSAPRALFSKIGKSAQGKVTLASTAPAPSFASRVTRSHAATAEPSAPLAGSKRRADAPLHHEAGHGPTAPKGGRPSARR